MKQIFCYLKDTVNHELIYMKHDENLVNYSDSDYADDVSTCWSTAEYVFYLAEDLIIYKSSLMKIVVLSTAETEYMILYSAVQEAVWFKDFLNHVNHIIELIMIYENNCSAIALTKNPEIHSQSKHIDVCFHWLCQIINEGIDITWIEDSNQAADDFTKVLNANCFERFIIMLCMINHFTWSRWTMKRQNLIIRFGLYQLNMSFM